MNAYLRTGLSIAIAATAIPAHAKPVDRCVSMLEARPSIVPANDAVNGRPRCPLAISWTHRDDVRTPRGADAPRTSPSHEARADDAPDAPVESIEPASHTLHV